MANRSRCNFCLCCVIWSIGFYRIIDGLLLLNSRIATMISRWRSDITCCVGRLASSFLRSLMYFCMRDSLGMQQNMLPVQVWRKQTSRKLSECQIRKIHMVHAWNNTGLQKKFENKCLSRKWMARRHRFQWIIGECRGTFRKGSWEICSNRSTRTTNRLKIFY